MNGAELKEVVATLPSYSQWSEKIGEWTQLRANGNGSAQKGTEVEQAERNLKLARAKAAVAVPRALLLSEVAEARQALPLPYRLGVLAVFNNPRRPLLSEDKIFTTLPDLFSGSIPQYNEEVGPQDFHRPSLNPYTDAAGMGKVLEDTLKKANHQKQTPVAHLHLGRMRPNLTRPTRAEFYLIPRGENGFILEEPVVDKNTEVPVVSHHIPPIRAADATFDIKSMRIVRQARTATFSKDYISIPAIEQLQDSRSEGKLLFGKDATLFAIRNHFKKKAERSRRRQADERLSRIRVR